MKKKTCKINHQLFHGYLSLALIASLALIGFSGIIAYSKMFAMIFLAVIAAGGSMILIGFCSKCPCRFKTCSHIIFGPLTRFLPLRKPNDYSVADYVLTIAGAAGIVLYPQFWLVKKQLFLITFWFTGLLLCTEILVFLCKKCRNNKCPASPNYKM